MIRTAIMFAAFLGCVACAVEPETNGDYAGAVDGDSLYLESLETQIRLFGVDAPERSEIGFTASRVYLTKLVLRKSVSCREIERDRYDRIVARCFMKDGREINRLMLDEPHTDEYCRYSKGHYGHC